MRNAEIPHYFDAVQDKHRRGWIGRYQIPAGVRYVRDEAGLVEIFQDKDEAIRRAGIAMCRDLDKGREPRSALAKIFNVVGTGRNRRASPAT